MGMESDPLSQNQMTRKYKISLKEINCNTSPYNTHNFMREMLTVFYELSSEAQIKYTDCNEQN